VLMTAPTGSGKTLAAPPARPGSERGDQGQMRRAGHWGSTDRPTPTRCAHRPRRPGAWEARSSACPRPRAGATRAAARRAARGRSSSRSTMRPIRSPVTGRSAGSASGEVRAGHQPQDRQGPRADDPAVAPAAGRPGHRVAPLLELLSGCGQGTLSACSMSCCYRLMNRGHS
jgi:hypothetical protein